VLICAPHLRPPHSPPEQDRECCGHKHEIYPRAVQGEIRDRDKEQRKQRNSRHSGDSSYQLNSPEFEAAIPSPKVEVPGQREVHLVCVRVVLEKP
jgi:hypothetical protein